MRILKFIVNNNKISRDPNSNFDSITSGEELIVDFRFEGRGWENTIKVAAFFNADGECPPQKLIDGMYCPIPKEALSGHWFRVQIMANRNGTLMITNKLDVLLNGGAR